MKKVYYTPNEVTEILEGRFKLKTLANWRSEGIGPPALRLRGRILYPIDEFHQWERQAHRIGGKQTSELSACNAPTSASARPSLEGDIALVESYIVHQGRLYRGMSPSDPRFIWSSNKRWRRVKVVRRPESWGRLIEASEAEHMCPGSTSPLGQDLPNQEHAKASSSLVTCEALTHQKARALDILSSVYPEKVAAALELAKEILGDRVQR